MLVKLFTLKFEWSNNLCRISWLHQKCHMSWKCPWQADSKCRLIQFGNQFLQIQKSQFVCSFFFFLLFDDLISSRFETWYLSSLLGYLFRRSWHQSALNLTSSPSMAMHLMHLYYPFHFYENLHKKPMIRTSNIMLQHHKNTTFAFFGWILSVKYSLVC